MNSKLIITLFFLLFSIFSKAQNKENLSFVIPENPYQLNKLIDEIEKDNKKYEIEIRECDRLLRIFNSNLREYKDVNIRDFKDYQSLFSFWSKVYFNEVEYQNLSNADLYDVIRKFSREINTSNFLQNAPFEVKNNIQTFLTLTKLTDTEYQKIEKGKSVIIKSHEVAINSTNSVKSELREKFNVNSTKLERLYGEIGKNSNLHEIAIRWGLPLFCLTIIVLFFIPYFFERNSSNVEISINSKQSIVNLATVLLLTMTILILGLAKMITGEVLGTLLGGISAYVLNRSLSKQN